MTTPPLTIRELKAKAKANRRAADYYRVQELPRGHFYPDFYEEWADGLEQSAKAREIEIEGMEAV